MPRSYLDGVARLTPGYHVSQVHGTGKVRVFVVEDDGSMLGASLARLCDLWGFTVQPITRDTFIVTSNGDES